MSSKKVRNFADRQLEYVRENRDGIRPKLIQLDRLLFGALLAIVLVLFGAMLSISGSKSLEVAAIAFSIAIPCLAMSIFSQELSAIYGFDLKNPIKLALSLFGVVSTMVGVASSFWHLTPTATYAFLGSSTVCFITVVYHHLRLGVAYEMEIDKKT